MKDDRISNPENMSVAVGQDATPCRIRRPVLRNHRWVRWLPGRGENQADYEQPEHDQPHQHEQRLAANVRVKQACLVGWVHWEPSAPAVRARTLEQRRPVTRYRRTVRPGTPFLRPRRSRAVSWVVPSQAVSEHPPARISDGVAYVTHLINAVMSCPDWNSTAIFLAWDDWAASTTTSSPRSSTRTATDCASPPSSSAPTHDRATSTTNPEL